MELTLSLLLASAAAAASLPRDLTARQQGNQPINPQYKAEVLGAIAALAPHYSTTSKVWDNTVTGFEAATVYQDLMDYKHWIGDASVDLYANNLVAIVQDQNNLNSVGAQNEFNDDREWWILAFLHAYRAFPEHPEFLAQAEKMYKQIAASSLLDSPNAGTTPNLGGVQRSVQIPKTCDVAGAVYWEQTPDSSINAVSTGLMAQIGGRLYGLTKQEYYRQVADDTLNYERRVLQGSNGIINVDSITTATCEHNNANLCYNTGIFIDACTSLYLATNDADYLNWGTASVKSAISGVFGNRPEAPLVIDQGKNSQDTFFNALTEYYVMLKDKNLNTELQGQIKNFVKANHDYVVAHDLRSNGFWSENWIAADAGTGWGTGSVLSLFMAAMIML